MDTRTIPDWSSLPIDLWFEIGKKLRTRIDTLRFRAVCASFRSSTPLPPRAFSPLSDLMRGFGEQFYVSLFESTVYVIEPLHAISIAEEKATKTWLATVEELNSGKVLLDRSISVYNFSQKTPKSFNLLDYRVKEIAKGYRLQRPIGGLHKVAVSSFIDIDHPFAVMLIYDDPKLCIPRNEDKKWTTLRNSSNSSFVDIVYHNKKFYALDFFGSVIAVDPKSLNVSKVANPLPSGSYRHLLKMFEDLLLIEIKVNSDGEPHSLRGFSSHDLITYKLDEDKCMWVHAMNVLEDNMLFIGFDCSFILLAEEVSEFKRNCVYLTDE